MDQEFTIPVEIGRNHNLLCPENCPFLSEGTYDHTSCSADLEAEKSVNKYIDDEDEVDLESWAHGGHLEIVYREKRKAREKELKDKYGEPLPDPCYLSWPTPGSKCPLVTGIPIVIKPATKVGGVIQQVKS